VKSVWIHGALALLGLTLAYLTWTKPEEEAADEDSGAVDILACAEPQLAKIELETKGQIVSMVPEKGAEEPTYWVTTSKKAEQKDNVGAGEAKAPGKDEAGLTGPDAGAPEAADGGAPSDTVADKPEPPKQPRPHDPDAPVTFLADKKKVGSAIERFTPLSALRGLGVVSEARYAEFGFDEPDTELRFECGGKSVVLEIGGRTYGSGHRYARDPKSKQAYLLDGKLVTDIQSARFKFMQSTLHGFELADVDAATVTAHGKSRRLLHRDRKVEERAQWVDAAAPDRRNELFGNWFGRLEQLKVRSYLEPNAGPGADLQVAASPAEPVLQLEYEVEDQPPAKLELVRVRAQDKEFFYARSETTGRWVTMYDSVAKQVVQDAALVVGAEVEAEPEVSPLQSVAPDAAPAAAPTPAAADPHAHGAPGATPAAHGAPPAAHGGTPPEAPAGHPPAGH